MNLSKFIIYFLNVCLILLINTQLTFGQSNPSITSFSPLSAEVGSNIVITGSNFSSTPANNIVYFGGVKGTIVSSSSTQIVVTVPKHSSHAPIQVNVQGKIANSSLLFSVKNTDISDKVVSSKSFNDQVSFTSVSGQYTTLGSYATDKLIGVGDFDGDGLIDIVKSGSNSQIAVHRNTTSQEQLIDSNSFSAFSSYSTGEASWSVEVADIDGDGKLDIISAGSTSVSILRNASTGPGVIAFDNFVNFSTSGSSNLEINDVDGDGLTPM